MDVETYDRLVEQGILAGVELIDGRLVMGRYEIDLTAEQRAAARAAGVPLDELPTPGRSRPGAAADEVQEAGDLADAALVADVANALHRWREAHAGKLGNLKLFRETVWFYWQQPRLPRPLIRGKYPTTVPWSAAARAAYHANPKQPRGLVIEHSRPMEVLLHQLLDAAPLGAEESLRILRKPQTYAVVTDAESRALGNAAPDESNPLAKYAAAGMNVSGFRPLSEEL